MICENVCEYCFVRWNKTSQVHSYLVKFQANQTSDESGGSSDGWNNLSSNKLGVMAISGVDGVVGSSQIGPRGNKVNVEIGVVILYRHQFSSSSGCNQHTFSNSAGLRRRPAYCDGCGSWLMI
jgi:hypothetical protein